MGWPSPPTQTLPRWITGEASCCPAANVPAPSMHENQCMSNGPLGFTHLPTCSTAAPICSCVLKSTVDLPLALRACAHVQQLKHLTLVVLSWSQQSFGCVAVRNVDRDPHNVSSTLYILPPMYTRGEGFLHLQPTNQVVQMCHQHLSLHV